MTPIPLVKALRDDVRAHIPAGLDGESRLRRSIRVVGVVALSSGFHLTAIHRLSHTIRSRWGPVGRPAVAALFWVGRHLYGCSIAPTARIGGGLILPHPQGIVVGAGASIGPRAWIFQNVTVGGAPGREGLPEVGSDARIYAGAVLSGPIRLGDRVVVGANAVVARDIPSMTVARAPAADLAPIVEAAP